MRGKGPEHLCPCYHSLQFLSKSFDDRHCWKPDCSVVSLFLHINIFFGTASSRDYRQRLAPRTSMVEGEFNQI